MCARSNEDLSALISNGGSFREIYLFDVSYSDVYLPPAHLARINPSLLRPLKDIPERMRVQRRSIVRLENATLCTSSGNTFVKLPYGDEEDLLGGLSTSASLRCGTVMSHGPSDPMCSRPHHFSFPSSAVISTTSSLSFLPPSFATAFGSLYFQLYASLPRRALVSGGLFLHLWLTEVHAYFCVHAVVTLAELDERPYVSRVGVPLSCLRRYILRWRCISSRTTGSSPPIDTIVETCMCARRKARGTEQNRGGSSWLPQAKAASAAGTLAAENISIGAARLRGPPILIRIPIFKSLEVAKISAGRKCFTRRRRLKDIQDIDWRRLLLAVSFFPEETRDYIPKNLREIL